MIRFRLMKPSRQQELVDMLIKAGIQKMLTDVGGGDMEYDSCISAYPKKETKVCDVPGEGPQ